MFTPEERRKMMEDHTEKALAAPRVKRVDKTALSYWFPLIEAAGLPVPKTVIVPMPLQAQECIWALFDGEDGAHPGVMLAFVGHLKLMAEQVGGYPCFLRTDHTSGKHEWDKTCFVKSADVMAQHVADLAMNSEMAGGCGLPWDVWVVREYLPIIPVGVCPLFNNMPVNREFRFFVDDGKVRCWHPYWPMEALEQGDVQADADIATIYEELSDLTNPEFFIIQNMAERAGRAIGGSWSIDILETKRGWFVTDMAEADKSWHWPECSA